MRCSLPKVFIRTGIDDPSTRSNNKALFPPLALHTRSVISASSRIGLTGDLNPLKLALPLQKVHELRQVFEKHVQAFRGPLRAPRVILKSVSDEESLAFGMLRSAQA